LVEQRIENPRVGGSIPPQATRFQRLGGFTAPGVLPWRAAQLNREAYSVVDPLSRPPDRGSLVKVKSMTSPSNAAAGLCAALSEGVPRAAPERCDTRVAIVAIGRNEGARLAGCLSSLAGLGGAVVYVDSGSRDDSVAVARRAGVHVHELDPSKPFSAARARNEGFEQVRRISPQVEFVQFIDGDCTLASGWLGAAVEAMDSRANLAVVVGHLAERHPEASIYNRLCALEWSSSPGDLQDFGGLGGIMLVRASVFASLNGFRTEVIAGEDSEFGVRCGLAGHAITKVDALMAVHDADMHTFTQWWTRAVRSGHAIGQRAQLNGASTLRDCRRDRVSVLAWGVALPVVAALLAPFTSGVSLLAAGALYGWLASRVFRTRRGRGDSAADAWLYARHIAVGKLAQGIGLMRYQLSALRGHFHIIEYK
jgi:GT2 family glycosyltransferase